MTDFISRQFALHSIVMPQDIIKMCFQAAYGAEHLLTDTEKARAFFMREYESCEPNSETLFEFIAPEVCRVNIAAWKKLSLPPEWLFELFVRSAFVRLPNGDKIFFEYVNEWSRFVRESGQALAFSFDDFQEYLQSYFNECENNKPRAVHHSEKYRKIEKPAYRVISGHFTRLVPILEALAGKTGGVIAIDGRAASGKSILAESLRAVIGAEIIRMDDFFLPPSLRTEERLNEPGGNVHYERFVQEVLPFLNAKLNSTNRNSSCDEKLHSPETEFNSTQNESPCYENSSLHKKQNPAFEYRIFNCNIMDYDGVRKIKPSSWQIVEGSYSHHPGFGKYADLRVFSQCPAKTQKERILARNGEKLAQIFMKKWIPMEEKYFQIYNIAEKAHLVV